MQIVPITSIVIPENRQRREFDPDKLIELAESIKSKGLIHAIVTRSTPNGPVLVAGERRTRALASIYMMGGVVRYDGHTIPEGSIPITDVGELSALEAMEAELEENTVRADLTWQERAQAEAALHDLRMSQAALAGRAHTIRDTIEEIVGNRVSEEATQTQRSITLARHLDNPEIAKAKTAREAHKILTKIEERNSNAALAKAIGATFTSAQHTLVRADSCDWLRDSSGGVFDVILTDPPYGMGADEFGDAGGALSAAEHSYADDEETFRRLLGVFGPESYRVAKDQSHLYVFCDIDKFPYLKELFGRAGWRVHRTPLIWHKVHGHRIPWPDMGPRRCWEAILYAVKGDKKVMHVGKSDVISVPLDPNLGLAAQKPVELYKELLSRSAVAGAKVLDAFCGTGPIFPAAHELKIAATGIERSESTYAIAAKRLEQLK